MYFLTFSSILKGCHKAPIQTRRLSSNKNPMIATSILLGRILSQTKGSSICSIATIRNVQRFQRMGGGGGETQIPQSLIRDSLGIYHLQVLQGGKYGTTVLQEFIRGMGTHIAYNDTGSSQSLPNAGWEGGFHSLVNRVRLHQGDIPLRSSLPQCDTRRHHTPSFPQRQIVQHPTPHLLRQSIHPHSPVTTIHSSRVETHTTNYGSLSLSQIDSSFPVEQAVISLTVIL
mmetsp:Transcript_19530/g.35444  ORF Transcript_19530/g.35444 Transcript_19530/m.35444 type:complete len:229 (+) Transcript_19530:1222-1908(+)